MRIRGTRQYLPPDEIYRRSFGIIADEFGEHDYPDDEMLIRTRIAHTSADIQFARTFLFHPRGISAGVEALKAGCNIVTDVTMVAAGIKARLPKDFGGRLSCLLYDDDVAQVARMRGSTKSAVALAKAAPLFHGGIVAIGNAPTALFELIDLMEEGEAAPALVIGVPVGFVGAAESKAELMDTEVPWISNPDRRGGSPLAAAIVNGLIYLANHG